MYLDVIIIIAQNHWKRNNSTRTFASRDNSQHFSREKIRRIFPRYNVNLILTLVSFTNPLTNAYSDKESYWWYILLTWGFITSAISFIFPHFQYRICQFSKTNGNFSCESSLHLWATLGKINGNYSARQNQWWWRKTNHFWPQKIRLN